MPDPPALESVCKDYLTRVRDVQNQTRATGELSYRDALGQFLRESAQALGRSATWTGEAKALAVGRPDYSVTEGLKEIGYVEAESVTADLGRLAGHAKHQNDRFKQNLHALLLTNHLDFQLWVGGSLVETARFSMPAPQGGVKVVAASVAEWERLLSRFLSESVPAARSAEDVARHLAKRAKELRFAADVLLSQDDSALEPFFNAYKQTLYADLTKDKFGDIYAQTFTYGLFLAWLSHDGGAFTPSRALSEIPATVPPIKVLLDFGGGSALPDEFAWIVAGICSDLDNAVRDAVMRPFADGRDPIMHFYETFLAAYDPRMRESRGVYYTPDSVVEFIVRAVDDLLQSDFGKAEGLADPSVTLLDPAAGTATFLAHAYRHVHATMHSRGGGGQWPARAEQHVARHFYGFELLPAAYTLAQIKLRALLAELRAPLPDNARLPVYLTNTLDEGIAADVSLPFLNVLSKEAMNAKTIKNQKDVLVVLGNPPYSGHSSNPSRDEKGEFTHIGRLVDAYFTVDGAKLGERNSKWLQDDYVKFLRFAEDRIARTGQGIVAFITNHGYLDNPTFRGMRRHLMTTFDRLYFYDLHGNSLKKERAPDGGKDENVFKIQQGVGICVLVKLPPGRGPLTPNNGGTGEEASLPAPPLLGAGGASLFHADLWGVEKHKDATLQAQTLATVPWEPLYPTAPSYLFVPQDDTLLEEYERGWKITEAMPLNSVNLRTHRDSLVLDFDKERLVSRIKDVANPNFSDDSIRAKYDLHDNRDWSLSDARKQLQGQPDWGHWSAKIRLCHYRPFDFRWIFYDKSLVEYPSYSVVGQFTQDNVGFTTTRQTTTVGFEHILATRYVTELKCVSHDRGGYSFPLYIYPTEQEKEFGIEKHANLAPAFVKELTERIGREATPEETFGYLYGVLHSPAYRERYAEFLKRDFPRLPLPPDAAVFRDMAALGSRLVALHLLEDPALRSALPAFPHAGTNVVEKRRADKRYGGGKIHLNETQSFTDVPPDVWEYRVGGYQPAAKWLDDRAGRALSDADITHYRRMLAALRETLALLPGVDAVFARVLAAGLGEGGGA